MLESDPIAVRFGVRQSYLPPSAACLAKRKLRTPRQGPGQQQLPGTDSRMRGPGNHAPDGPRHGPPAGTANQPRRPGQPDRRSRCRCGATSRTIRCASTPKAKARS
ncbi:hypothetical protein LP420_03970 [Massilia sp. B-10]|nr:hypothetical protein LP420_03970 [Massilia sp. B-10]